MILLSNACVFCSVYHLSLIIYIYIYIYMIHCIMLHYIVLLYYDYDIDCVVLFYCCCTGIVSSGSSSSEHFFTFCNYRIIYFELNIYTLCITCV